MIFILFLYVKNRNIKLNLRLESKIEYKTNKIHVYFGKIKNIRNKKDFTCSNAIRISYVAKRHLHTKKFKMITKKMNILYY